MNKIKDKIMTKQLQHGDYLKIAEKSGFSHSTVRKWYTGDLKVKEDTEQKNT